MKRITGTLHDDISTFTVISLSFLVRMTRISDKFLEKTKTRILCSVPIVLKYHTFNP